MSNKFNPKDPTTWPPKDQPVLWLVHDKDKKELITIAATLQYVDVYVEEEDYNPTFEESGITGHEWESLLVFNMPIAWQPIPEWNL